jgi:N utilization substance protein B
MSTSYRTQGRRLALQVLYSLEYQEKLPDLLSNAFEMAAPKAPPQAKEFAEDLVEEVLNHREYLDEKIAGASPRWNIDRIHPLERNILRIGLYEITCRPDIPGRVSLNEAVDLAKHFGDEEAWRFINGVLQELGGKRIELEGAAPTKAPDEDPGD